jgi:hypothetical protein
VAMVPASLAIIMAPFGIGATAVRFGRGWPCKSEQGKQKRGGKVLGHR